MSQRNVSGLHKLGLRRALDCSPTGRGSNFLSLPSASALMSCTTSNFTKIDLSSSALVRSNIGGLGGRCDSNGALGR